MIRTYNHVHNTLRLFDCLASFPFTTSEMKRDYYKYGIYELLHEFPNDLRKSAKLCPLHAHAPTRPARPCPHAPTCTARPRAHVP